MLVIFSYMVAEIGLKRTYSCNEVSINESLDCSSISSDVFLILSHSFLKGRKITDKRLYLLLVSIKSSLNFGAAVSYSLNGSIKGNVCLHKVRNSFIQLADIGSVALNCPGQLSQRIGKFGNLFVKTIYQFVNISFVSFICFELRNLSAES